MHFFSRTKALALLSLINCWILLAPAALSHGGHGNEFSDKEKTGSSEVKIEAETAQRIGVKVSPVQKQSLKVEIVATGQIELLPNQKVEVTAPIKGKILQMLVQPGARIKAGQAVATMTSPELGDLRVAAQEKKSEAVASLQQAQADMQLAQDSYGKIQRIAKAEEAQALSQLAAAQSRLLTEQQLVKRGSIVQVAKTSYQRQQQISKAEISAAQIELNVALDRYQKDAELAAGGALPRRQVLESQAKLAEAQTALAKAKGQPGLLQAETELRKAETDLPLRELRDAEKQVAEAKGQLSKAVNQKSLVEADAQLRKSQSAVTAAQSRQNLSAATYNTRIAQLGNSDNQNGIITIKSAIDGIVADSDITTGQSVADAGAKLMTITNDQQVMATANIYEKDLGKVKLGQDARVKVGTEVFAGAISRIGTSVDGQSRVVPVQVALSNSSGSLKPGMFAELRLATDESTVPLLAVPSAAIIEAEGKKIVYVQNGDSYQPVTVTLGQAVGDLIEVKAGLFAGDKVVTQRAPQLYAQSLKAPAKADEHTTGAESKVASGLSIAGLRIPLNPLWLVIPGALAIGGGVWWLVKSKKRNQFDDEAAAVTIVQDDIVQNDADLVDFNEPLPNISEPIIEVATGTQNHAETPDSDIVTNDFKIELTSKLVPVPETTLYSLFQLTNNYRAK
jgi:membrane fusion protein, heavy metal efflux system